MSSSGRRLKVGCGQCGYRSSTLREVNLDSLSEIIGELLAELGAGTPGFILGDVHVAAMSEAELDAHLERGVQAFAFAGNDEAACLLAAVKAMDGQRIWSLSEAQMREEFGRYLPSKGKSFDEIVKRAAADTLLSAMKFGLSIRLFEQNQELKSETEAYSALLSAINATALLSVALGEFKPEQWEEASEKARLELVRRAFDN